MKVCEGHGEGGAQVEYHNWPGSAVKPDYMLKVLARLVSKDMRVFHVEPNLW